MSKNLQFGKASIPVAGLMRTFASRSIRKTCLSPALAPSGTGACEVEQHGIHVNNNLIRGLGTYCSQPKSCM